MKFTAHFFRTELTQIIADALKSQGFEMESLALFDEHSERVEFSFASAPVTHIEQKTQTYHVKEISAAGNPIIKSGLFEQEAVLYRNHWNEKHPERFFVVGIDENT